MIILMRLYYYLNFTVDDLNHFSPLWYLIKSIGTYIYILLICFAKYILKEMLIAAWIILISNISFSKGNATTEKGGGQGGLLVSRHRTLTHETRIQR